MRWSSWLMVATAAVFPACGDGTPVARGFGSRQVLQIRDSTFSFQGDGFSSTSIVYSTSDDGGTSLFSVDLTTGQVRTVSPPDAGSGGEPDACPIGVDVVTSTPTLTVTDPQTGQQTTIEGVWEVWQCPSSASTTLTVLRSDATGALTLWSGTADNLQQVPLPVTIVQHVYFISTFFYSGLFFAAWPAQPTELGLFAIDRTTFAVTEVVPPTLGTAAWANGADGTTQLTSSSLLGAQPPSSPYGGEVTRIGNRYVHERAMADGSVVMFAGPFPSGPASELALFEVAPYAYLAPFPEFETFLGSMLVRLPLVAWQYVDSTAQQRSLLVWHDGLQELVECPLPAALIGVSSETPDLTNVLFGASIYHSQGSTGPLALVSFASAAQGGSGTCTLLASANASYAGFSLDGSASFWVIQPYNGDATLWTAASDGSGARMIGSGAIGEPRYVVGTELEFNLGGDLVWVDTSDPSSTLHYVAEQVFGYALDVAGPWVVTGYDFSHQDATGLLGVVNRENGNKLLISPEVVTYQDQYQYQGLGGGSLFPEVDAGLGGALPDAGAATMQIAYLVRGRNPSSQDGIWVATINVGDLP